MRFLFHVLVFIVVVVNVGCSINYPRSISFKKHKSLYVEDGWFTAFSNGKVSMGRLSINSKDSSKYLLFYNTYRVKEEKIELKNGFYVDYKCENDFVLAAYSLKKDQDTVFKMMDNVNENNGRFFIELDEEVRSVSVYLNNLSLHFTCKSEFLINKVFYINECIPNRDRYYSEIDTSLIGSVSKMGK